MKLLIKFPTRGRPEKAVETLKKYIDLTDDLNNTKIIVSIDNDDKTLSEDMFNIHPCVQTISGPSLGKIGAINRDVPDPSTFDILLLASDDMIPTVKGYDAIIRTKMVEHFPDTDGVLWFNDGYAGFRLNTLVICGSKYYSRFGYIYCPEYKSLFCDNEFMDVANRLGRQIYFNEIIIKHEHPANNSLIKSDQLYDINEKYWDIDKKTYEDRKFKDYDLTVMICTIPSRYTMFIDLWNSINKLKQNTTLSVEVLYDSRKNVNIGEKRNYLLKLASGKYCCFVDDDDTITDDYFKVIEESELKYDCVSLNGMRYVDGKKDRPFYHSLKYSKWFEDEKGYYRNPNHLNPIRSDIAKRMRFPEKNNGEDFGFSKQLLELDLLKTEYVHDKIQYNYMFVSGKPVPITVNLNKLLKRRF